MRELNKDSEENYSYVFTDVVVFQFSDDKSGVLTGLAELCLDLYADALPEAISINDILRTRVDILQVYNENGHDIYAEVMADLAMKNRLELAALQYFIHPPAEKPVLPRIWKEY